jgi:predicted dehydrogenase
MKQVEVAVVGTGWCGGIRAETCAQYPSVAAVHVAEIRAERLGEVAKATAAQTATSDYRELLRNERIDIVFVCATPETTHYPIARDALAAGKHVFLEKPIALTFEEADELIESARRGGRKFTIGYSQRFNPKFAYVKQSLETGKLGRPVSVLVSRNITRSLGNNISGRIKLSPAAMEATHDLDFVLWCLEPRKPVRVYAQCAYGAMREARGEGVPDSMWMLITMDDGVVVTVGAGWSLPPGYPNFSSTWIEFLGTEGGVLVDDTHRDVAIRTMQRGTEFPISSMPGESVGHVFAGPMAEETRHFVDAVVFDRPVMVRPESARLVMELYTAADLSAERNAAVGLPLATARSREVLAR